MGRWLVDETTRTENHLNKKNILIQFSDAFQKTILVRKKLQKFGADT